MIDGSLDGWDDLEQRTLEALKKPYADLVAKGYEYIVDRSPVKTGAYRAEHIIGEGSPPRGILYEAPNRVGPDVEIEFDGSVLEAPSVGDARAALQDLNPLESVTIYNDRFYAELIESGSSQQAPLGVYQVSADALEEFGPVDNEVIA